MGATTVRLSVSINRLYPGEKLLQGDERWGKFNGAFQTEEHTPESLFEEVAKRGHAFCCALNGYRKAESFVSAQLLALDFDSGDVGIGDLLADSFIAQYATFIYPTISWTPDTPKCRVVFILTEGITEAETYRKAATALLHRYETTDQHVKDPARLFFGTKPGNGESLFVGNVLPMTEVLKLFTAYEDYRRTLEKESNRRQLPSVDSSRIMGSTQEERYVSTVIAQEGQWLSRQVEGTGERHNGLIIVAARLESVRLSTWLSPESREAIDPFAVALDAAEANGYVAKYGEASARRAIEWGINVAEARPMPQDWGSPPQLPKNSDQDSAVINDALQPLPFRTAQELSSLTPERPDWIVDGLLARGAITELDGKVKSGKSTFILAMMAAILRGDLFLGLKTQAVSILLLTEERPPSFRALLERVGLADEKRLHILSRTEVRDVSWPVVVTQAVEYAQATGAKVLVVDTLSRWAGLKDDSENNAGAAMEAMAPLETAAQELAVLISRHDRKSGGELGDSGRGSSAFSGISDIVLSLRRADTEGHASRRTLLGVGRFDNVPQQLIIEWRDGRYANLGEVAAVERLNVEKLILDHVPGPDGTPNTESELLELFGRGVARSTFKRAMDDLIERGLANKKKGYGDTKKAYGYWLTADGVNQLSNIGNDPGQSNKARNTQVSPGNRVSRGTPPEPLIETESTESVEGLTADQVSSPASINGHTIDTEPVSPGQERRRVEV